MDYSITTYDAKGNVIVERQFKSDINANLMTARENYADQIESILEDSAQYLEEQVVDYKEELTKE